MTGVLVRRARTDEAVVLAAVAAETFPLACLPGAPQESIAAFIADHLTAESFTRYLADPALLLFLAEVDGAVAGYSMLHLGEPSDPEVAAVVTMRPTAELSKLYVRQCHHGRGVAPALVSACVEAALDGGSRSVWLGVQQLNERANRFYERQGFARVGTKRFLVGESYEDDYVRELALGRRSVSTAVRLGVSNGT